jgi:hypothetical protein
MRGWWGGISLLRSMCFVLAVTSVSGFKPVSRDELKAAVEAWCADSVSAINTYGDIKTWDVRIRICTHSSCCPPHPRP